MPRYAGYDYIEQCEVRRTKREWRELINGLCDANCFIRAEAGETFVHQRTPRGATLVLEVYRTPSQLGIKR